MQESVWDRLNPNTEGRAHEHASRLQFAQDSDNRDNR